MSNTLLKPCKQNTMASETTSENILQPCGNADVSIKVLLNKVEKQHLHLRMRISLLAVDTFRVNVWV